jgi:hypothetical protein
MDSFKKGRFRIGLKADLMTSDRTEPFSKICPKPRFHKHIKTGTRNTNF